MKNDINQRRGFGAVMLTAILLALGMLALIWYVNTDDTRNRIASASSPTVMYHPDDVPAAWDAWRSRQITREGAGPEPRQRVLTGTQGHTISEGQAYGMLFAAMFDEQDLFDGLWLFARDHLNDNGLMAWYVESHGNIRDYGAASDADLDIALALVMVCDYVRDGRWAAGDIDYCQDAQTMIAANWQHNIDRPGPGPSGGLDDNPGYELLPGDRWNLRENFQDGVTSPSYFSPAHYRVFAEFSGNPGWYDVVDRAYEIARLSQENAPGCAPLIVDWVTYEGVPQLRDEDNQNAIRWAWNAPRVIWRAALDAVWFDSAEADTLLNPLAGFFGSVGIDNVRAVYRLDGTAVHDYQTPFFTAHAAVAVWKAPDPQPITCGEASADRQSTPQQAYDALLSQTINDYYNDAWRLFSLMLITGQIPPAPQLESAST